MIYGKGRISIKYAIFLLLCTINIPSVRFGVKMSSMFAKQAALLSVIFAVIILYVYIFLIDKIMQSFKGKSLSEIYGTVFGPVIGRIILCFYIFWLSFMGALYIKYYSQRGMYISTPDTNENIYIVLMLIVVALVLHKGIVLLTRMSTIIFYLLLGMFFISLVFAIPDIKIDNLIPISYYDVWPAFLGSFGYVSLFGFLTYILFFMDKINNLERFKSFSYKFFIPYTIIFGTVNILLTVGTIGHNLVNKSTIPFFLASKPIRIFETFGRIEALFVGISMLGDFVTISVFSYAIIQINQYVFKLKETKFMINSYVIFLAIFVNVIALNFFELEEFSMLLGVPLIMVFSYLIPIVTLLVAKLRRII